MLYFYAYYVHKNISKLIRKSQANNENLEDDNIVVVDDVESDGDGDDDDDGPEDIDDKRRQKEMRKGIDLATTLERIEKNFVITDPRLPDNPIVRFSYSIVCVSFSDPLFLDSSCL